MTPADLEAITQPAAARRNRVGSATNCSRHPGAAEEIRLLIVDGRVRGVLGVDRHAADRVDGEARERFWRGNGVRDHALVTERHDLGERVERDLLLGAGTPLPGRGADPGQLRVGHAALAQRVHDRRRTAHARHQRNIGIRSVNAASQGVIVVVAHGRRPRPSSPAPRRAR